jgi:hypothetical protein
MWPLTPHRVSGPEIFQLSAKKDFLKTIGAKRTFTKLTMSVKWHKTEDSSWPGKVRS